MGHSLWASQPSGQGDLRWTFSNQEIPTTLNSNGYRETSMEATWLLLDEFYATGWRLQWELLRPAAGCRTGLTLQSANATACGPTQPLRRARNAAAATDVPVAGHGETAKPQQSVGDWLGQPAAAPGRSSSVPTFSRAHGLPQSGNGTREASHDDE